MLSIPKVEAAPAKGAGRSKAVETLMLGFAADPVARWFFPEAWQYVGAGRRFAEGFGGRAFEHGTAFVADETKAVALWLPPGVEPDEAMMGGAIEEAMRPEKAADANAVLEAMAKYHPAEPHWYLPLMAADPMCFGQGLGSALLKHALTLVDRDRLPAYLESSNPRNLSLYERHGFEVVGKIQAGSSPTLTPMLRPAR